jgi:hypothetical protein
MYPVDRHTIQWLDVCCYSELLARGLARVSCRLASGWRKGTICFNDCYVVHGWDIVIPHTNRELLMLIVIYDSPVKDHTRKGKVLRKGDRVFREGREVEPL